MMMSTTTSSMTTTTTMLPTTSRSRQKIRGVHKSKWEFLSRLPGTKNFITRRPRKTSRHQGYGNSKTRFPKQLLETKNSFATREHEEKNKARDQNMRRRTCSAAHAEIMQNQWFSWGSFRTHNSHKAAFVLFVFVQTMFGLGFPKRTSGHQELQSLTTRSEVSRGRSTNS